MTFFHEPVLHADVQQVPRHPFARRILAAQQVFGDVALVRLRHFLSPEGDRIHFGALLGLRDLAHHVSGPDRQFAFQRHFVHFSSSSPRF